MICKSCWETGPDVQETLESGPHCAKCREGLGLSAIDRSDPDPPTANDERYARAYELLGEDTLADLDTCCRCKTLMLASDGEMTDKGFRCSDCLEVARKFETLTEAIRIVQAAVKEAYPTTAESSYTVEFVSNGFIDIICHLHKEHGGEVPHSGFADAEGLASDFLHRIRNRKQ